MVSVSLKIAIVGNGSFCRADASVIDDCDFVVRFNDCRSWGAGGLRTDVVAVCNTGRPAPLMIRQLSWRAHPAVSTASAIWCVRDSSKFAELKATLDPALEDFCNDYTAEFVMFARETAKDLTVIPRRHHDRIDGELRAIGSESYVVPSSGLIAIAYIVAELAGPEDSVMLAGFDHQGWSGHPFSAERQLIDRYVLEGRLRRLKSDHMLPTMSDA